MLGSAEQLNVPPANNETKASDNLNLESFNHSLLHYIVPKWNTIIVRLSSVYKTLNTCNTVLQPMVSREK